MGQAGGRPLALPYNFPWLGEELRLCDRGMDAPVTWLNGGSLTVFKEILFKTLAVAAVVRLLGRILRREKAANADATLARIQDVVLLVSGDAAVAERLPERYGYGDVHGIPVACVRRTYLS